MNAHLHLYTADKCFISVVFDQWLEDSHCLDSKEAWDADPKRPFPYEAIEKFLASHGLDGVEQIAHLMIGEAMLRIFEIVSMAGAHAGLTMRVTGLPNPEKSNANPEVILDFKYEGLSNKQIVMIAKCLSLMLNISKGFWPFGLNIIEQSDDTDKAS